MPNLFKTKKAEEAYFKTYDKILSFWPVEHEPIEVKTSVGSTHLNAAGPKGYPPLLLFPGFASNSTMYWPNIGTLAKHCRVYAIDTIGQPGRSLPARPLTTANCISWILEILDHLNIDRAHIMGLSLGGWLSLKFAIEEPARTNKVILLDPAASFAPMSGSFFFHSFIPFMIHPTRKGLIRFFRWLTQGYPPNPVYGEMMLQGVLNTNPQPPLRPSPFTDAQLQALLSPVFLLVGGKSLIYNPERVINRARKLIPGVHAEILANASHALNMEQVDLVNERLNAFLTEGTNT